MATNTLIAWYLISGGNASLEKSRMKIVSDYTISISGSNAVATFKSTMYVHRDSYGPTTYAAASNCYIGINGTTVKVCADGTTLPSLGTSYVQIGNQVTHTVTYPAGEAKAVSITAGFNSTNSSTKLQGFVIPTSNYSRGTAGIDSGNTSITLPKQATACAAPTSFSVSPSIFESNVTLSWSGAKAGTSNSITGYEIQYCTSTDNSFWGSWAAVKTVNSTATSGTTQDTPGIARSVYQKFRIRVTGSAGSSFYSGWKESNSARKNGLPVAPTSFSTSSNLIVSGASITLSWSGASDADGNLSQYRIQKNSNGSWADVATVASTSGSGSRSVTLSESAGTTVQFRIRAEDSLGAVSGYKTGVSVIINSAPGAPTSFTPSTTLINSGTTVKFSWSGASDVNSNITSYQIYTSTNNGSTWTLSNTTNTTATSGSASIAISANAGTAVQVRIRAVDKLGATSGYKNSPNIIINSAPTAPTAFNVSKTTYNQGDSLTLTWSGAGDANNNISSYTIQSKMTTGDVWQAWRDEISTAGTSCIMAPNAENHGQVQYRICTKDTLGLVSGYKESAIITRDDATGVHVWAGSALKKGYVYVCKDGKYIEGELYICKSGKYVKGVD